MNTSLPQRDVQPGKHSHVTVGEMLVFGEPAYNQIMHFLIQEAKALDELRTTDWLAMLDENIFYHMPIRRTTMRSGAEPFDEQSNWFHETKASIEFKIRRIVNSGSAWADDPANRVRRFISNLTIYETGEKDIYLAESYLLVTRSRGDETQSDLISARRDDVLRKNPDGSFSIVRRSIFADQTVLGIPALPFFL